MRHTVHTWEQGQHDAGRIILLQTTYTPTNWCWVMALAKYSFRPKINSILGLDMQINASCKITPLTFRYLLAFSMRNLGDSYLLWLVDQNYILCETNLEFRIAFILGRGEQLSVANAAPHHTGSISCGRLVLTQLADLERSRMLASHHYYNTQAYGR
jgi:hypothetical protein